MKSRKDIGLLCAGLALAFGMILLFLPIMHKSFPMWEKAQERTVTSNVLMAFVELDRKEDEDIIVVNLKNEGDKLCTTDPPYSIDYEKNGVWYTVCKISCVPGPSASHGISPNGTCNIRIPVPKGLLDTPGKYRVCLDDVGFCDIESDGKKNIYESLPHFSTCILRSVL